jgi:hypothetical protein
VLFLNETGEFVKQENQDYDPDALYGEAEPWESWETKLVLGSISIGLLGLVILGWLVNRFILE